MLHENKEAARNLQNLELNGCVTNSMQEWITTMHDAHFKLTYHCWHEAGVLQLWTVYLGTHNRVVA